MQRRSRWLLLVMPALLAGVGRAADLEALIEQHVRGSDEARLAVIDAGAEAIPGLVEVIRTQPGGPAERAAHAVGWIAEFAASSPERARVEWALVNVLVDRQQPVLARQTAARHLWHVARPDAVPALAALIEDPDVASEVLWSLQNLRGKRALSALTEACGSAEGTAAAPILDALGRRPDAPVSLLTEAAETSEPVVRLVALEALGRKGDVSVAAFLQRRAEAADGDERIAALLALVSVGDALRHADDTDAARRTYERALELGDDVRAVVLGSLRGLSTTGDGDTAGVVARFLGRSNPSVQVAAASVLARLPGRAATDILAGELAGSGLQKARPILSALADRADPSAVDAVIPLARVDNTDVRKMALAALGRMGDRAGCEVVLEAYQDPTAATGVRNAAFGAYLSVASAQAVRGRHDVARELHEGAVVMAATDEHRAAALNGLTTVAGAQSLPIIEPSLAAEGAEKEAAIGAYLAGADALAATGDRDAAVVAYTKLLNAAASSPRAVEIARRLGSLGSSIDPGSLKGFVTHWLVIGPFPSDKDYGGTDAVYPIEKMLGLDTDQPFGEPNVTGTRRHTLDAEGIMDYVPMFEQHQNVMCYAYAEVTLGQATEARLHVGSDDSIVVWVNGAEAHRFKGPRGLKVGEDTRDVVLQAGVNRVLIKVVQGGGDWSSSLQLTDRNNQPLRFEQKTE